MEANLVKLILGKKADNVFHNIQKVNKKNDINISTFELSRAFGAKPLEDVVKNLRTVIMTELETALAQQAPPTPVGDPTR